MFFFSRSPSPGEKTAVRAAISSPLRAGNRITVSKLDTREQLDKHVNELFLDDGTGDFTVWPANQRHSLEVLILNSSNVAAGFTNPHGAPLVEHFSFSSGNTVTPVSAQPQVPHEDAQPGTSASAPPPATTSSSAGTTISHQRQLEQENEELKSRVRKLEALQKRVEES